MTPTRRKPTPKTPDDDEPDALPLRADVHLASLRAADEHAGGAAQSSRVEDGGSKRSLSAPTGRSAAAPAHYRATRGTRGTH